MFESAKLKIERADHHIADLDAAFDAFLRENTYVPTIENHPEAQTARVSIRFSAFPPLMRFASIVGDAIHNLRCALDHMTWELVGNDGGAQNRHLQFPARDNRVNFEAACKGIETPSQAVRDILSSFHVYPGGKGERLYQLHRLDNADKHTILTPIINSSRITNLTLVNDDGTIRDRLGTANLIGSGSRAEDHFFVLAGLPKGVIVKVNEDTDITPDIFLGDFEGVPLQPIRSLMSALRYSTAEAIDLVARTII